MPIGRKVHTKPGNVNELSSPWLAAVRGANAKLKSGMNSSSTSTIFTLLLIVYFSLQLGR